MANKWISQAGAGTADGSSFANRAPESSFASLESAMGASDTMYISAETITLTAIWSVTGNTKRFVGVNATTGVEDGSLATLDASNTYSNCLAGNSYSYLQFRNIEGIRATSWALLAGSFGLVYNCKARNSAHGIIYNSYSIVINSQAINNTGYGFGGLSFGMWNYCQAIGNGNGFGGGISSIFNSIVHANTGLGVTGCTVIDGCIIDGNGTGINNAGGYSSHVARSSITYNTTGITTDATATSWVAETKNYFYNNTTKFGGTTSAIYSLGGSIDGASDPYNARASDDFRPAISAPMINTSFPFGLKAESVNLSYLNSGLNPAIASSTAPTFGGITSVDALSTGKFKISWTAGSGTITSYDIHVWTATNPFAQKKISVDSTLTSVVLSTLGDGNTFFVGGQTYYFGVRASNSGTQDTNTVEISAVCTGSEFIQRINNTYPIIKL